MKTHRMILLIATVLTIGIGMFLFSADTTTSEDGQTSFTLGVKSSCAKEKKDNKTWHCICQLYSDKKPKKRVGEWSGIVSSNASRWYTEWIEANSVCEEETARQGRAVNCKDCSCGR